MDKDAIVQHLAQGSTWFTKWFGVGGTLYGVFTLNELFGLIGLLVAVVGTVYNSRVNKYYKKREDSRAQERHEAIKAGWMKDPSL